MKNAYTEEEIMFHMSILKIRDVLLKRERESDIIFYNANYSSTQINCSNNLISWFDTIHKINENCYSTNNNKFTIHA